MTLLLTVVGEMTRSMMAEISKIGLRITLTQVGEQAMMRAGRMMPVAVEVDGRKRML